MFSKTRVPAKAAGCICAKLKWRRRLRGAANAKVRGSAIKTAKSAENILLEPLKK